MQGGIEGEMGQDGWYHHQTKAIEHMGIPFLNMATAPWVLPIRLLPPA